MTMTKANVVETICVKNKFLKKQSIETFETLLEIVKQTLESGEHILISGFGKLYVKHKKKRKGRNPATGEDMMITPRKVVIFRCSSQLKDRINAK